MKPTFDVDDTMFSVAAYTCETKILRTTSTGICRQCREGVWQCRVAKDDVDFVVGMVFRVAWILRTLCCLWATCITGKTTPQRRSSRVWRRVDGPFRCSVGSIQVVSIKGNMSLTNSAKQRYRDAMRASHVMETVKSPRSTQRQRLSFFGDNPSRVDSETSGGVGKRTGTLSRVGSRTSFTAPGSVLPTAEATQKPTRSLRTSFCTSNPSFCFEQGSELQGSITSVPPSPRRVSADGWKCMERNVSDLQISAILGVKRPATTQNTTTVTSSSMASDCRPQRKTHAARFATNMQTTTIGGATSARKQSRWSRKKSIELAKAQFLAETKPKNYGFAVDATKPVPLKHPPPVAEPRSRRHFEMVVSARHAVTPPWAIN